MEAVFLELRKAHVLLLHCWVDRREHAGGAPQAERIGDQWSGTCDFPYEIIDGLPSEQEQLYPMEKFSGALREIAGWMVNDGKFQTRGVSDRAMVFAWMIIHPLSEAEI